MSVSIYCAGCNSKYAANPGAVEKVVRCPKGHPLTVPAASAPPTTTREAVRPSVPDVPPSNSLNRFVVLGCIGLVGLLLSLGVAAIIVVVLATGPATNPVDTGSGYAAAPTQPEPRSQTELGSGPTPVPVPTPMPIPTKPVESNPTQGNGASKPLPDPEPKPSQPNKTEPKPVEPPTAFLGDLRTVDRLDRTKLDNFKPEEPKSPAQSEAKIDQPPPPPPDVWDGHTNHVRCVAFTDDGQFVISVSGDLWRNKKGRKPDNSIRVWDARTGKQLHALKDFKEALDSLCISPGGRFASFTYGSYWQGDKYVRSKDNNIYLLDIQTKKVLEKKFEGLESSVFSTAISPDRTRVMAGDAASNLRLWDSNTRQTVMQGEVQILKGFIRGVVRARFSPDGKRLVVVVADHTARVFDARTSQQLGPPLTSHEDIIWDLALHQGKDGVLWAITGGGSRQTREGGFEDGAKDYAIRLWNLDVRGEPRLFNAHTNDVTALAFCPDGRHFVSGGVDDKVLLWDVLKDRPVRTLGEHKGSVQSIAVSPDGRSCVSGGTDNKVRFWRLPTAHDLTDALAKTKPDDFKRVVETDLDIIGVEALTVFPKLVQALHHPDAGFRDPARRTITQLAALAPKGDLPFEACPLSDVLKVLEGDHPIEWKAVAIRDVSSFGADAKTAVPVLLKMNLGNSEIAVAIAETLGKVGEKSPEVFQRLHTWLDHKEPRVRRQSILALNALGPNALKLPTVLELTQKETDSQVQATLLKTFQDMVRDVKPSDLDALRTGLASNQAAICLPCVEAIGSFGRDGAAAVPELLALFSRNDVQVRLAALRAIGAVGAGNKSAVAELEKLIDPKVDGGVCTQATITLAQIDSGNKVVLDRGVPLLMDRLLDPNESVRRLAQDGFAQIGPKAVFPLTLKMIEGNDNQRRVAAEALAKLGPKAESAIPDLTEALRDSKAPVRAAAAEALGKIGEKSLPVLVKCLTDPDENVRKAAADGLGVMGPLAKSAIPALRKVETSNDKRTVTGAASRALDKIDPNRKPKN